MFPGGSDKREFWQRAEDRNFGTAKTYDSLGLPEFYALEGFVQWRERPGRLAICCWPSAFALFRPFFALLGGVGQQAEGERGCLV